MKNKLPITLKTLLRLSIALALSLILISLSYGHLPTPHATDLEVENEKIVVWNYKNFMSAYCHTNYYKLEQCELYQYDPSTNNYIKETNSYPIGSLLAGQPKPVFYMIYASYGVYPKIKRGIQKFKVIAKNDNGAISETYFDFTATDCTLPNEKDIKACCKYVYKGQMKDGKCHICGDGSCSGYETNEDCSQDCKVDVCSYQLNFEKFYLKYDRSTASSIQSTYTYGGTKVASYETKNWGYSMSLTQDYIPNTVKITADKKSIIAKPVKIENSNIVDVEYCLDSNQNSKCDNQEICCPKTEVCNDGKDNDCDGVADEGCKADNAACIQANECKGNNCVHNKCSSAAFINNDGYCDPSETFASTDCKKNAGEKCTQETTSSSQSSNECKTKYCRKTNTKDLICTNNFDYYCGDGYCNINYESYAASSGKAACPADCKCGNGIIEAGETITTCPADACTTALTNTNSQCCAAKGGCFDAAITPGTCRFGEIAKEVSCSDNIDNDCDGKKDLDDADCCNPSTNTLVDSTAYSGVKRCVPKTEIVALGTNLQEASLCAWGSVVQKKSSAGGKENDKGGNTCSDSIDNDCDGQKDNGDADCCSGKIVGCISAQPMAWVCASSDTACCNQNECVKNGKCYTPSKLASSLNQKGNDNNIFCSSSNWYDCDVYPGSCTASTCGGGISIKSGENILHGEYTGLSSIGCCGDDATEYYAAASNSKLCPGVSSSIAACCDNPTDKVDANGKCVPANECPKLNGDDCNINTECQGTFCVKVPGKTGKCSNAATICGDGYCDANGEKENNCPQDCCIDGDASQACCTVKKGSWEPSYLSSNKCCGDDISDANSVQMYGTAKFVCVVNQQNCAGWQSNFDNNNGGCLSACQTAGFKIADGGEVNGFGGYATGNKLGDCCGDDLTEYYPAKQTAGKSICCNAQTDCVDSAGKCQSGKEDCSNKIDDDCDGKTDDNDEDCCNDGDKDQNCCTQKTGVWLNAGSGKNCCGDDQADYGTILTYNTKQYLCAKAVSELGEAVTSWIDAAGKKAEITLFQKIGNKGRAFGDALKNAVSAVKTEKTKKEQDVEERKLTTKNEEEKRKKDAKKDASALPGLRRN